MNNMELAGKKKLILISGRAHPQLSQDIADQLGISLLPTDARTFANGEIYARFDESVRGTDAFVIQSHCNPINEWLMEQLIMVDALKRASAKRITVVAPFYPYARQDKKSRGREPISARLIADLFKTAGADRIMSVLDQLGLKEDECIEHAMVTRAMANAREKIESMVKYEVVAKSEEEWFLKNIKK